MSSACSFSVYPKIGKSSASNVRTVPLDLHATAVRFHVSITRVRGAQELSIRELARRDPRGVASWSCCGSPDCRRCCWLRRSVARRDCSLPYAWRDSTLWRGRC